MLVPVLCDDKHTEAHLLDDHCSRLPPPPPPPPLHLTPPALLLGLVVAGLLCTSQLLHILFLGLVVAGLALNLLLVARLKRLALGHDALDDVARAEVGWRGQRAEHAQSARHGIALLRAYGVHECVHVCVCARESTGAFVNVEGGPEIPSPFQQSA